MQTVKIALKDSAVSAHPEVRSVGTQMDGPPGGPQTQEEIQREILRLTRLTYQSLVQQSPAKSNPNPPAKSEKKSVKSVKPDQSDAKLESIKPPTESSAQSKKQTPATEITKPPPKESSTQSGKQKSATEKTKAPPTESSAQSENQKPATEKTKPPPTESSAQSTKSSSKSKSTPSAMNIPVSSASVVVPSPMMSPSEGREFERMWAGGDGRSTAVVPLQRLPDHKLKSISDRAKTKTKAKSKSPPPKRRRSEVKSKEFVSSSSSDSE